MRSVLFFLLISTVYSRNFRDFQRVNDEPFQVNSDLFNEALSLLPPDSEDLEDLKVTTSKRFTGPSVFDMITALPPAYSPMSPGFSTLEEKAELDRRELDIFKGRRDDRFRIAEIDADRDESFDITEDDKRKVERELENEISDSVPELVIQASTMTYSDEQIPVFEGSGLFHDEQSTALRPANSSQEKRGESAEEIAFLLGLPRIKVSGEVGMESNELDNVSRGKKNTVSVNTFLWPSLAVEGDQQEEFSNRTRPLRGAVEGCPTPKLCGMNCFVSLDEQGCQSCQCLWQAVTCEKNSDCPESSQHCDLGKCDCSEGFIQDMTRSGMCKVAEMPRDDLSLESLGVEKAEQKEESLYSKKLKVLKREKRAARFGDEKPRSAERLQWPGPCDVNSHCPRGLVCIRGDCWQLPDKPLRRKRLRDSVPDSFVISSDDNLEMESEVENLKTPQPKRRSLRRFVGNPEPQMTKELLERTTVAPMENQPNSLFEWQKTSVEAEEPQLAPSTVSGWRFEAKIPSELYTSTHNWMVTGDEPQPDDLPPSPPPDNIGEEVSKLAWPEMPPDSVLKAFTKMIELPREQVLKPKVRSKESEQRKQSTTTETVSTLDPIEFPISSQLESLKNDGIDVEPPLALSVTPTDEEVESHEQFMRALEEQRRRVQTKSAGSPSFSTNPPSQPQETTPLVLQSLRESERDEEQKPGVWYEMRFANRSMNNSERRRSPPTTSADPFPVTGRKRPIKVNGIVGGKLSDECTPEGRQCGQKFRCCLKRWCDSSNFCSLARFCLPSCFNTKTINRRVGQLDLVED